MKRFMKKPGAGWGPEHAETPECQKTGCQETFNEDMILREGLPVDVFRLIHDLCYFSDDGTNWKLTNVIERARNILKSEYGVCPKCNHFMRIYGCDFCLHNEEENVVPMNYSLSQKRVIPAVEGMRGAVQCDGCGTTITSPSELCDECKGGAA